jgi:hypothetical protein
MKAVAPNSPPAVYKVVYSTWRLSGSRNGRSTHCTRLALPGSIRAGALTARAAAATSFKHPRRCGGRVADRRAQQIPSGSSHSSAGADRRFPVTTPIRSETGVRY